MLNRFTWLVAHALIAIFVAAGYGQANGPNLRRTLPSPRHLKPRHIPSVRLAHSRRLVTVGDTLYMLDSRGATIWKWDSGYGEDLMDRPYIDRHGNIFGIASEALVFSLDPNGKERWRWQLNGEYDLTQLTPYRNDQYLIVISALAYRKYRGYKEGDILYLCHDYDIVSKVDFPRDAKLRVEGHRIFAVTKKGIRRVRIS